MKSRKVFFAALACLLAAPVVFVACGDDHSHAPTPTGGACGDPNLLSLPSCTAGTERFSDEACAVFDDHITRGVTVDAARSPSITAPTEMQSLAAATPFTFAWTAPVAWRRPATWRDELARWTSLVPEAEAHCEPFSGRAYELTFKVRGATVLRRQQSATSWTVDAPAWQRLRAAAGASVVDLTLTTVIFNTNAISAGAGPFTSGVVRHFTISN